MITIWLHYTENYSVSYTLNDVINLLLPYLIPRFLNSTGDNAGHGSTVTLVSWKNCL